MLLNHVFPREVKEVQDKKIQTARYQLYQDLVKRNNLQIADNALLLLMKERGLKP